MESYLRYPESCLFARLGRPKTEDKPFQECSSPPHESALRRNLGSSPNFDVAYFKKTKKTARMRQQNATRWFHWSAWPLKKTVTRTVKTVSEMTSWITLSCIRLNGPPLPLNPIRLAGTCAQYSKNATPQENRMTRIKGHPVEIFIS